MILAPVAHIIDVHGPVDDRRPVPLEVDGRLVLAGQVRDDGRARAFNIGHEFKWAGRRALVLPGEGLQPELVLGEGL